MSDQDLDKIRAGSVSPGLSPEPPDGDGTPQPDIGPNALQLTSVSVDTEDSSRGADTDFSSKESASNEKTKDIAPALYQFIYCLIYFVMGAMFSATVVVLPYLEEQLNINASESSLIYSMCYFAQIFGSLFAGKAISQKKIKNSHLYLIFISFLGCLCLFLIQFIKSYLIMIGIFFIVGVWLGGLSVMPCVYVCRVYGLQGAVIFSRLVLCQSLGSSVFSIVYSQDYVNLLWYAVIGASVFYSCFLLFILPTPQESKLIQLMTDKVLENADIEVREEIS